MKKSVLAISAVVSAALMMSFVSCNKKAETAAPASAPAAEAKAAEPAAPAPAKAAEVKPLSDARYVSANDIDKGVVSTSLEQPDGFVLVATEEKAMEVQSIADVPKTVGEDIFTQRISTKGSGKVDFRNISFPAKAGETIRCYALSSSKTDSRPLHVVNVESGEEIGVITMEPDNGSNPVTVGDVAVAKDGTYCVYATSGTGYIYQVIVGK